MLNKKGEKGKVLEIRKIYKYILAYLLVISQGSVLTKINADYFTILITVISLLILFFSLKGKIKTYFAYPMLMLSVCLFVAIIASKGSLSIFSWVTVFSRFLLAYTVYMTLKDDIWPMCIRVIISLSFLSLISFLLQQFNVSIFRYLPLRSQYLGLTYYGGLFIAYLPGYTVRNFGIFGEPGLHQIVVNMAIYMILFHYEKLGFSRRYRRFLLTIMMICIVTIQSTAGYFSSIVLIALYFYCNCKNDRQMRRYIAFIASLFVLYIALNPVDNIFIESFVNKVFDADGKMNLSAGSGQSRVVSMGADWAVAIRYPLGAGFDKYLSVWSSFLSQHIPDGASCVGITKSLATIGIPATLVMTFFYIKNAIINRNTWPETLALLFMLFNTCLSEPSYYFPIYIAFVMVSRKKMKQKGDALQSCNCY